MAETHLNQETHIHCENCGQYLVTAVKITPTLSDFTARIDETCKRCGNVITHHGTNLDFIDKRLVPEVPTPADKK